MATRYDQLTVTYKGDDCEVADKFRKAVEKSGKSINAVIKDLISEYIKRK